MGTEFRRLIYSNPSARSWTASASPDHSSQIRQFYSSLPDFAPSPLIPLDDLAQELGIKKVFVKAETSRLGLPSFKLLGASWAVRQSIIHRGGLPPTTSLDDLRAAAKEHDVKLVAATDGNHGKYGALFFPSGNVSRDICSRSISRSNNSKYLPEEVIANSPLTARAVAKMGNLLGIKGTKIFVPKGLDEMTKDSIAGEGAEVIVVDGDYDESVRKAHEWGEKTPGGMLIEGIAFEGYEDVPRWTVEGYTTMLFEIDEQLQLQPNVVVAPVGVGSLAQSIASHYKTGSGVTAVLTVEPDTAASLYKSLKMGKSTTITTSSTIMTGLECGTISTAAWPILEKGIDASTTVSDFEVYEAIRYLENAGIFAGPCGAAALAGFKHVARKAPHLLRLDKDAVVVLICTEGSRGYKIPKSVSQDDLSTLTRNLEQLDSASSAGTGKIELTTYIAQWLEHRDIEIHWLESIPGQPSIVGTVRGGSGEKSMELNAHSDSIEYLAASIIALSRFKAANLNGVLP